jgi:hypothetical protein
MTAYLIQIDARAGEYRDIETPTGLSVGGFLNVAGVGSAVDRRTTRPTIIADRQTPSPARRLSSCRMADGRQWISIPQACASGRDFEAQAFT